MRQANIVLTALAGLLFLAFTACLRVEAAERLPNVLLVTVDGLRPEQLGPDTPAYAALAQNGTVFSNAFPAGGHVRENAASLLTGLYPRRHGCTGATGTLATEHFSVLEAIHAEGIQTGALTSGSLENGRGLEQGVERWQDLAADPEDAANKAALWLDLQEQRGEPWCLWIHLPGEDAAAIDSALGALRAKLTAIGQARDTITVFAGLWVTPPHEGPIDDDRLRVPLLVHKHGLGAAVVDEAVSIADVGVTLFELVGLDVPAELDGASLAPGMLALPYDRLPAYSTHADRDLVIDETWLLVGMHAADALAYDRSELPLSPGEGTRPPAAEQERLAFELAVQRGELPRVAPEPAPAE